MSDERRERDALNRKRGVMTADNDWNQSNDPIADMQAAIKADEEQRKRGPQPYVITPGQYRFLLAMFERFKVRRK